MYDTDTIDAADFTARDLTASEWEAAYAEAQHEQGSCCDHDFYRAMIAEARAFEAGE